MAYPIDDLHRPERARQAGVTTVLERLALPIVVAPMAGDPDTPAIAVDVSDRGGLGIVSAGYRSTAQFREDVAVARAMTARPLGVKVFLGGGYVADPARALAFAMTHLPGPPSFQGHAFEAKMEVLLDHPVAVVSFALGLPGQGVVDELHAAGSEVWLPATSPRTARRAAARGADALVVDGVDAADLAVTGAAVRIPVVASRSLATRAGLTRVLAAGAAAAELGAEEARPWIRMPARAAVA
jgi:nitronate monooxygenase